MMDYQDYLQVKAKEILLKNWRDGFTVPTNKLYPFQWNWDSGFTCLGQSYFSLNMVIEEMTNLFSGQWENGMIPHIVFHSENETTYFPNHDFWNAQVNNGASNKPKTSGITQPPVHGFVLECIYKRYKDNEKAIAFIKSIYNKVVKSHRFFYTYRDPKKEGLAFIFHPWESGRDNSPLWDRSLMRMEVDKSLLPHFERQDNKISNEDERPTDEDYNKYVYLLELGKKYQYDGIGIFEESPFLIQDTLINAILIKSNESLINLGSEFGFDTGELKEWQTQSKIQFREKLWNETLGAFASYDLRGSETINHKEIGGFVSLFAGIPNERQSNLMNDYYLQLHKRGYYLCPSFDVDSPLFDSKRYWRGPIWPQMNWLIYQGLRRFEFEETADIVRSDFIEIIGKLGFYEYFESQKHLVENMTNGYGGGDFSWTASCFLDFILEGQI